MIKPDPKAEPIGDLPKSCVRQQKLNYTTLVHLLYENRSVTGFKEAHRQKQLCCLMLCVRVRLRASITVSLPLDEPVTGLV